MLAILNSINAYNFPIFQPILVILVSKFMVHRALSDRTYLSLGLLCNYFQKSNSGIYHQCQYFGSRSGLTFCNFLCWVIFLDFVDFLFFSKLCNFFK